MERLLKASIVLNFSSWKKSIEFIDFSLRASKNPFDQDETNNVCVAQINGPWHQKMSAYIEEAGAKGLDLSFHNGFRYEDPGFLSKLPFIELFTMPHFKAEYELGGLQIEDLTEIRRFKAMDKVAREIDFSAFSHLQSCTLRWQPKAKGIFQTDTLKNLQIYGLNWKKADGLGGLQNLENLEIANSGMRSFEPISGLKNLKRLELSVCHRLESLEGIASLQNLRSLHIDEVHSLTDLECLTPLQNLEVLTIVDVGDIKSIAPLATLRNLKAICIAGTKTKIIDGDLTPLTRLPHLAMLTLPNKRHYSHCVVKKWSWDNLNTPDTQLAVA